jgi:methionyl-tRNA formyltransferase
MAAPPRTLFFGSGDVALPTLRRLLEPGLVELDSVVTAPARPAGRGQLLTATVVAELAGEHGLPVRTPASLRHEDVISELRAVGPELIVLVDYGRIIPAAVLAMPRHGALNIHPSLLPRHRGAAPVQGAIAAGDPVTGVTLMLMDEGLDSGPIVAQVEVPLEGDEIAPELAAKLAELGAELLVSALPAWLDGSLSAQPQPATGASLTRPLRREDGRLDPARPATELERQVRAYQPWPGTFVELGAERLKVWAASVVRAASAPAGALWHAPGTLLPWDDSLALVTADGLLRLDEVQPPGKRRMRGAEYRRGRHL